MLRIVVAGFLTALLLSIGSPYAHGASVLPGNTSATPQLEMDTLERVRASEMAESACCDEREIANREVVTATAAKAVEHWTIVRRLGVNPTLVLAIAPPLCLSDIHRSRRIGETKAAERRRSRAPILAFPAHYGHHAVARGSAADTGHGSPASAAEVALAFRRASQRSTRGVSPLEP